MASMFAANLMEIGLVVGMVVGGIVFLAKGIIHRPVRVHLWPQMIVYGASHIAYCDDR